MILRERCENYCQGFSKCMKKEKVKSTRWFTWEMVGSSQSRAKISPVAEGTK